MSNKERLEELIEFLKVHNIIAGIEAIEEDDTFIHYLIILPNDDILEIAFCKDTQMVSNIEISSYLGLC